jgi:hypothetical protein
MKLFLKVLWLRYTVIQYLNNIMKNKKFTQEAHLEQNEYSVNIPTEKGWINVVNPFRATLVLGVPGSGKTFAVVSSYIRQQLEKGFSMYLYDYQFPELTELAYNHLRLYPGGYKSGVQPKFYTINFDDLRKSHRCNPIDPTFMTSIAEAFECACTIMLNLNKTWIQKQGDFFVESPIILLAAIIWYLKIYDSGKYCTFPHAIELLSKEYTDIFAMLTSYPELERYLSPFMSAWRGEAHDQLQEQVEAIKSSLSRIASKQLYWVMGGNDFTLDINNPEHPKILCVGNKPNGQTDYSAALGLYSARIVKLMNKAQQLKSAVIIDELSTIYFRGLGHLIATGGNNKIAVCLSLQDISQLERRYGSEEAAAIVNTAGNIFSGQAFSNTAEKVSGYLNSAIPASQIADLAQGTFVGRRFVDYDISGQEKIFHAKIAVDANKIEADRKKYVEIPAAVSDDRLNEMVDENFERIKADVSRMVDENKVTFPPKPAKK